MPTQLTYPTSEIMHPMGYRIKLIHKNVMDVMTKLGGNVINSSYVLLDGVAKEAHGHYRFPKVGAVMTSVYYSKNLICNFSVKFLGFKNERSKFNNIKMHIVEVLRKSGLNRTGKK